MKQNYQKNLPQTLRADTEDPDWIKVQTSLETLPKDKLEVFWIIASNMKEVDGKNKHDSAMNRLRKTRFFAKLTLWFDLYKSDIETIVYSEISLVNNLTESTFGIALLLLFIPTSHDIILESAVIASQLNIILGVFLIREKAFPPKNTLIFLASLTFFSITILSLISSISKPTFELALLATGTYSCIIALTMMFAEQGVILITHSVKTKMSTVEF